MSSVVFGPDGFMECKVGGEYKLVGCEISCEFNLSNELIGKTDANAGLSRKYRVRMSNTTGSVNGLTTLVSDDEVLSILYFLQEAVRRTEQDIRFSFKDQSGIEKQIQGLYLIENLRISAGVGSFSEFSLSLVGNSQPSITAIDPDTPTVPGTILSDWWVALPDTNFISGDGDRNGYSFAGGRIIEVAREGTQINESDVATEGFYSYNGTAIYFDPNNPFNDGERVFVIWEVL